MRNSHVRCCNDRDFVVLVASMISLASWSDKVVKEGSNHDDCFISYCCSNYGVLSVCIIKSGKVLIRELFIMIWVAVVITMLLFILVAKPTGIYLEKAFQGSKS